LQSGKLGKLICAISSLVYPIGFEDSMKLMHGLHFNSEAATAATDAKTAGGADDAKDVVG